MADLTIMTWLWSQPEGRVTYTAETVNIWADMLRRNLTIPHRLACVTDHPEGLRSDITIIEPPRDFENASVPTWGPRMPQCLRRLAMFSPDAGERFGNRFVSMDMDCVIAGNLDSLFTRSEDIVLYKSPGPADNPRPYNGSLLMMTAGARPQVYTTWTPQGSIDASARLLGSDQAWFSHVLGRGEATWTPDDGINWWQREDNNDDPRLMFFPGNPKPWQLCRTGGDDWVSKHYRASPSGRCVFADYGESLWGDVAKAGKYDGVIVTPEAAKAWPGQITDEAHDLREAERLATMHGFSRLVHCGKIKEAA